MVVLILLCRSENACDPTNFEPNLALSLEIADLINAKKGTAPREAAIALVNHVNNRNANISTLALHLLDICVKNCGYPFHLQISTKEFLNELVRRFPERPPMRSTRVMNKILELIEEWRCTICVTSKYKEDLGFIRDMHRLLSYKGYSFPAVKREDAAVLNPTDDLRSVEEMEAEEHAAQSAKLQELIRRGTPRDLQEANKLMKVMAGFDQRNKTDYRAKAAEEVASVQQKAKILEEMLQNFKPGDTVVEGDVFEELANALASAHPKIQKMCEEESDDHEAVAKLLEINDSIHRTVERYKLIKKGDLDGAARIPKGTLGISGVGVKTGPDNELSLIDFDGPGEQQQQQQQPASAQSQQTSASAPKGNALEDDLLGLSMGNDTTFPQGGGISLGMGDMGSMSGMSQPLPPTASAPNPAQSSQSGSKAQLARPNYDPFAAFSGPAPTPSGSNALSSSALDLLGGGISSVKASTTGQWQQSQSQSQPPQQQQQQQQSDPFASMIPTRSSNPLTSAHKTSRPTSISASQAQAPATAAAPQDDEWTFSSALPPASDKPSTHTLQVTAAHDQTYISIAFDVARPAGVNDWIGIESRISSTTQHNITDLTFQLAVTKGYTLKLEPQSTRTLGPHVSDGITQSIKLQGVQRGQGDSVKLRWRCGYTIVHATSGQRKQEEQQGEVSGLGVV